MLNPELQAQLPLIIKLFKESRIKSAYAFGSMVSDRFNDASDVDLLINFEDGLQPLEKGGLWWKLHDSLRDIFNKEIDLLIENSLKNPILSKRLMKRNN